MSPTVRPPALADLPPPPAGKMGWPWTIDRPTPADTRPEGSAWPRVSVVTPSYNQGLYIEETIRSVLLQGYPNLEYLVIDGGSVDQTIEIIHRYEPWLAKWISEKDRGQSHAVNKGWDQATGEIVAYLNSDDFYLPGAIHRVVEVFRARPECALVYGDAYWVKENGKPFLLQHSGQFNAAQMLTGQTPYGIPQPTAFMRRETVRTVGGLDETLHMAMDFDLWTKLLLTSRSHYISGKPLAVMRHHTTMKTQLRRLDDRIETLRVLDRALADPVCPPGVTRHGNRLYHRLYLDLAEIYWWERCAPQNSLRYLVRAARCRMWSTLVQMSMRTALRIYRVSIPQAARERFRLLRGSQIPVLPDVWD